MAFCVLEKEVKFSNFCILRIMGYQNGSQNLLSKFSFLFARTEQAEKREAICTGASASNSTARASHTKLQRNRIQSLWEICADSVASCIINDLCNSQISLSLSLKVPQEFFLLWLVTPSGLVWNIQLNFLSQLKLHLSPTE